MQWNSVDEGLYAVGNGIDNFHTIYPDIFTAWQAAVLPSETLMRLTEGANFGWPYAYYDHLLKKMLYSRVMGVMVKSLDGLVSLPSLCMDFPATGPRWRSCSIREINFLSVINTVPSSPFMDRLTAPPYPQAGYIVLFFTA